MPSTLQAPAAHAILLISAIAYSVPGWFLLWRLRYCAARRNGAASGRTASIIIPARNEATRLPALLASLEREGAFSRFEVILADDGSEDGTAALAEAAGCGVVPSAGRPEGANGKSWACWTAARAAEGELLLFLDADAWFLPGGLDAILAAYEGGLMSVQPFHRFERPYEGLSAFFNLMAMAGIGSFTLGAREGRASGCFGPCVLCDREEYLALGGHGGVAGELVDDVALAKAYAGAGKPVRNFAGRGSVEFRMYPGGAGELVEGWTKNMALASRSSAASAKAYFGVWCAGVATLFASFAFVPGSLLSLVASACAYGLYALQVFSILRRIGSWKIRHGLIFPALLAFFLGVLGVSAYRTFRAKEVTWKGRRIKVGPGARG